MGMSELWSQEGTFERALYMLRKYGRLHTTSTTSIGTFKICLHLVCPCPLKLLLVLVRFLVFLSCTVSLSLLSHRRGSHEARLFSRCHPGPVAHATDRERCTDVDCLGVSTYHSYVARFLRQICGFGSALQLWESESQILCSRFTSFSKHAWHVWAPDSSCVSDRNEKLQFQLLRHFKEFIRD